MAKILLSLFLFAESIWGQMVINASVEEASSLVDDSTWVVVDLDKAILPSPLLSELLQKAGAYCCITTKAPPLSPELLLQYSQLGFDLLCHPSVQAQLGNPSDEHWDKGILYLKDFNRDGEIFRKWLEISPIKPSRIVVLERHSCLKTSY